MNDSDMPVAMQEVSMTERPQGNPDETLTRNVDWSEDEILKNFDKEV